MSQPIDKAATPVLVTGGAGYIGSHAVLALRDAGYPVAVIDNLTTGFRFAVPDDVPFFHGDIEDESLLAQIFAEQGTRAVMHFAGSIVVPESVADPLGLLSQQHRQEPRADRGRRWRPGCRISSSRAPRRRMARPR